MRDRGADPLLAHCRAVIRRGSRSFARASALFDPETRDRAHLLYAWCRHCDDVIDGQQLGRGGPTARPGESASARVARMRTQTIAALRESEEPSEPPFQALRRVARACRIPERHPFDLLEGFAWDAAGRRYRTLEELLAYCYRVAGSVGVMMAHAMDVRDDDALRRAADLGIAFQLTNIARDVADDGRAGRVYLPLAWLAEAGVDPDACGTPAAAARVAPIVGRLLDEADRYYASAAEGLRGLSFRSAWAVAAAARIYRAIGRIVRARGAAAWDRRAVVPGPRKAAAVVLALGIAGAAVTLHRWRAPASRDGLWTATYSSDSPRGPNLGA